LAILYGNGKGFEKKILKLKFVLRINEAFDLKEAHVDVVDEKLLLSSTNLMKF
jgi:hypothetical protein